MKDFIRTTEGVYLHNSGANNYFAEWDLKIKKEKRFTGEWVVRTSFDEILCITRLLSEAKAWTLLYAQTLRDEAVIYQAS